MKLPGDVFGRLRRGSAHRPARLSIEAREALTFYGAAAGTVALSLALLLLVGCSPPPTPRPYDWSRLANVTSYPVHPTRTTPGGIAIDDPLFQVDDAQLDDVTDRLEQCLASMPVMTDQQLADSSCIYSYIPRSIDRSGFNVKVPPDWFQSACHPEQELFSCSIDPVLCDAAHLALKGQVPDPACPCACRATVQDDHTIVTAPNLLVYAGELLRLVTACNDVWLGVLDACANVYPQQQPAPSSN